MYVCKNPDNTMQKAMGSRWRIKCGSAWWEVIHIIFLCGVSTSFLCPLKVCFGSISLAEWSCLFFFHHILFADWWAVDPEDLQVSGGSDEKRSFLRSQCFSLNSVIFAFDITQEGNVCTGCLVSVHRFHGWIGCTHASFSPSSLKFIKLQKSR